MGLVDRFERKLETTVGDAFARVFGGSIAPPEVEAALQREAESGAHDVGGGRILAPNEYVITLSYTDFEKVNADPDLTPSAFAKHLEGFVHERGWQTYGEVVVRFEPSPGLHTGQFRAHGVVNPDSTAGPPRPAAPSDRVHTAEPGVPTMTDNPTHRPGQGQGQPGDEYDYGRQPEEQRTPVPATAASRCSPRPRRCRWRVRSGTPCECCRTTHYWPLTTSSGWSRWRECSDCCGRWRTVRAGGWSGRRDVGDIGVGGFGGPDRRAR